MSTGVWRHFGLPPPRAVQGAVHTAYWRYSAAFGAQGAFCPNPTQAGKYVDARATRSQNNHMTPHEIYRDANYLVLAHGDIRHDTSIVGFSWRSVDYHPNRPRDFDRRFLKDEMLAWNLAANLISIIPSRNCWYIGAGADLGLAAVRQAVAGTRVITYGSSMGAYAAINCATELDADYFIAASPLYTIFNPFMAAIGDRRYGPDRAVLPQTRDTTQTGAQADRRGLIIYDNHLPHDARHVEAIAKVSQASLLAVPHSGHPSGRRLNKIYPLKQILAEVVGNTFDLARVQAAVDATPLAPPAVKVRAALTLPTFLATLRHAPHTIAPDAWLAISGDLANALPAFGPDARAVVDELAKAAQEDARLRQAPRRYRLTTFQICRAYQALGARDRMRDYACTHLTDTQLLLRLFPTDEG